MGAEEVVQALAAAVPVEANEEGKKKPTQSEILLQLAVPARLFHTHDNEAGIGEVVMTTSGNAWFPHGSNASVVPFERWATETTFFVPVRAVIGLTGPGSVNGVEYRLASFDLCVITDSNFVSSVSVVGIAPFGPDVDDDQYLPLFDEAFPSPGLTTGCHTFEVGAAVGQGAGLMVEVTDISDGSPVTLSSVKSVWTPHAVQG